MPRALLFAVFLAGCVSTQPAPLTSAEGRAEVNARAASRIAVVHVRGERGGEVRGLHVGPDTTTWVDRWDGRARSVPTADLASVAIERGRPGGRLLKGAAIGVGVALGALAGETEGGSFLSWTPTQAAGLGGLGGVFFGGLVGLAATRRDVYRPAPPEAVAFHPCGGPPLACAAPPRNEGGVAPTR